MRNSTPENIASALQIKYNLFKVGLNDNQSGKNDITSGKDCPLVDSIKITSTPQTPKVTDMPAKSGGSDAIFDILNPEINIKVENLGSDASKDSFKEALMQNLQREILKPLKNSTTLEADTLRKLVLMAKLFESSAGAIPKELLNGIFKDTQDLLSELLLRDKTETIFKGSFFDSLRTLAKLDGYPQLKDSIVSVLKYFDAYVNKDQSFKAILSETIKLMDSMPKSQQDALASQLSKISILLSSQNGGPNSLNSHQNLIERLESLIKGPNISSLNNNEFSSQLDKILKNETIPTLGNLLRSPNTSEKQYQAINSLLNQIVRYDKGSAENLESAILRLADALKPLSNLSDTEIMEMKNQVFNHAKEAELLFGRLSTSRSPGMDGDQITDKSEVAQLLEKALSDSTPSKLQVTAQALLETLVRNESPVFPLMHFLIPFRFMDNDTYGEFFIDKDPESGEDGGGEQSTDIFFTIQSDRYGSFEVFMKVRSEVIQMEVKSPAPLVEVLEHNQDKIRNIIEEQGFRLSNYSVDEFKESQSILKRFPKLALRKVGLDVRI
ncbi:hypothetical protein Q5O24_04470 [Eubacteriaceae bacterium ES3]|nr:hypothetical protein Q5O24_04470 [Eubacteriaceae bacterium ES3]